MRVIKIEMGYEWHSFYVWACEDRKLGEVILLVFQIEISKRSCRLESAFDIASTPTDNNIIFSWEFHE